MKSLFSRMLFGSVAMLSFWSCKKDETQTRIDTGAAPTLTSSATTVVLNQSNGNDTALTFTWGPVNYGFSDAINYSLQFSKDSSFATATSTQVAINKNDLIKFFKVKDINRELLKIITPGVTSQVRVRIKSDVGSIYSNVITLTVTPYRDLILYAWPQAINIAGNFQGWSPATASQIVSLKNDGNYDGFIDFNDPSPQFKMVKGNDWSAGDYGSAGGNALGNGGPNLTLTGAGTYLIRANTTALTWSSYKINGWGLIGDGIPTTGWNSDHDLTYDPATKTWKITIDLVPGAIKFRANDDWAVNLGDKGNDGKPEFDGDNIPIAAAGNYTITLDISVAGNYVYSIKKN